MPDALTSKKSAPEAESIAQLRVLCQTDLYAFARDVLFRHLTPNLLTETLHRPLCTAMQTTPYDENLYMMFRGAFKSSIITTANVIQRILGDPDTWWCRERWRGRTCGPNTRILIASNKGENAEGFLAGIKGHLESNEILLSLFPRILVRDPARQAREWTQSAITVQRSRRDLRESTIQTIGVTGELVSKHYDHGVFDDPVAKENSETIAEREKVWQFFIKARPLFDPGATKDYVGTPWHYDDAWMRMTEARTQGRIKLGLYTQAAWVPTEARDPALIRRGVIGEVPGHGWVRVVFPEAFCLERDPTDPSDRRKELLDEWRRQPGYFNAQYLLNPVSADTAHFPRLDPKGQPNLQRAAAHPPLDELSLVMSIDPAQSLESHADYSAIAVGGFDHRGDLWLLELWQARRDDEALVRKVYDLHAQFRARGGAVLAIGFEAVGFARGYRHIFTIEGQRRGYTLNILAFGRDTNRTKQARIGLLQGPWMAKQIHVVETCEALADFIDQADKFRMDEQLKHDDILDAVADLYQLHGRPSVKAETWSGIDPEVAEQRAWESQVLAQRQAAQQGPLDRASLLVGWQMHRAAQQEATTAAQAGLGMLSEEFLEVGR